MTLRLGRDRFSVLFAVLIAFHAVTHMAAITRENINWDEFALLARAADSLRTGELHAGGRPGLAVFTLMPFVKECENGVSAVRAARWLWVVFTFALVAGFWVLLRGVLHGTGRAAHDAAFGVALLVLVPEFLRFSLQVRSDQPAIAFALWGCVALLASARRLPWAAVAGAAFAVGYLFSQKAVYVMALGALLVLGRHFMKAEFNLAREVVRAALFIAAAACALMYDALILRMYPPVSTFSFERGMDVFAFYRNTLGYSYYGQMAPGIVPGVSLVVIILLAFLAALVQRRMPDRAVIVAAAIIALGIGIVLFHAGAFPYFWMTLGLFPAAAAALGLEAVRRRYGPRNGKIVVASIWIYLMALSIPASLVLLKDTQRIQRDTVTYVNAYFAPSQEGFHAERALFCRDPTRPLPGFFTQSIYFRFHGADGAEQIRSFLDEFRRRRVAFLIHTFRLAEFPHEIRTFWREHYTSNGNAVLIPAPLVRGGRAGERTGVEVIVPGTYRWTAAGSSAAASIAIDGSQLTSGDTVRLAAGEHMVQLLEDLEGGRLTFVLAAEPPRLEQPFYKRF